MSVDLTLVVTPTPEPFDKTQPEKQRENMAFVMMQVIDQFIQQQGTLDIDIVEAIKALQFNHAVVRWGDLEITLSNQSYSETEL